MSVSNLVSLQNSRLWEQKGTKLNHEELTDEKLFKVQVVTLRGRFHLYWLDNVDLSKVWVRRKCKERLYVKVLSNSFARTNTISNKSVPWLLHTQSIKALIICCRPFSYLFFDKNVSFWTPQQTKICTFPLNLESIKWKIMLNWSKAEHLKWK